jgi:hypothetical protein
MASMRDLVARMRSGRIRSSEIADAMLTVSSLGERGVEALSASGGDRGVREGGDASMDRRRSRAPSFTRDLNAFG